MPLLPRLESRGVLAGLTAPNASPCPKRSQIRYSTSKSRKGAKAKTAKGRAKSSLKIAKLKGGKKYYVQVRTYKKAGGKTYYSSWSKAKTVRTAK